MKNYKKILKFFLVTLGVALGVGGLTVANSMNVEPSVLQATANKVTITKADVKDLGKSGGGESFTYEKSGFTFSTTNGYGASGEIRIYGNGEITISTTEHVINAIDINFKSQSGFPQSSWTGLTTKSWTAKNDSGTQAKINSITITYSTVSADKVVDAVTIDKSNLTVTSGESGSATLQMKATTTYTLPDKYGPEENQVYWTSSNELAPISETGLITFLDNCSSTITATSKLDSSKFDTATVVASGLTKPSKVTLDMNILDVANYNGGWTIDEKQPSFNLDSTVSVTTVGPRSNGKYDEYDGKKQLALYSDGSITFSVPSGYKILEFSTTYYTNNNSLLTPNGNTSKNFASGAKYTCETSQLTLVPTGGVKFETFHLIYGYNEKYEIKTVTASFKENKGTYIKTSRSTGLFKTSDLVVTATDGTGTIASTVTNGVGFKVTSTLFAQEIDATAAEKEVSLEKLTAGTYDLFVHYPVLGKEDLVSAAFTLTLNDNGVDSIVLDTAPTTTYTAFLDKYVEFDGGKFTITRLDGSTTTAKNNKEIKYYENGLETTLPLNAENKFTNTVDKTYEARIYSSEFVSEKYASYTLTVHAITEIYASDANINTYAAGDTLTMNAKVQGLVNGVKVDLPKTMYTVNPESFVGVEGEKTITVTLNGDPTKTASYTITVLPGKGNAVSYTNVASPLAVFEDGDTYSYGEVGNYGLVKYEGGAIYDETLLDDANLKYYLSTDSDGTNMIEITTSTVLKRKDNGKYVTVVYTENGADYSGVPYQITVNLAKPNVFLYKADTTLNFEGLAGQGGITSLPQETVTTTANGVEAPTASSFTKVYKDSGYLKLGSSGNSGSMVFTFAEGVSIGKVELDIQAWASDENKATVNGEELEIPLTYGTVSYENITNSNVIHFSTLERAKVKEIRFYTNYKDDARVPTLMDFDEAYLMLYTYHEDGSDGEGLCKQYYQDAIDCFSTILSDNDRVLYTQSGAFAKGYARLQAWALANNETISVSETGALTVGDAANAKFTEALTNTDNIVMIVVTSISVVGIISAYFLVKKHKEN